MTSEQHQFSNAWARGSDWWPIRKVGNAKWIVDNCGVWSLLGRIPVVFKTKRAATEFFESLAMERMREFRACEDQQVPNKRIPINHKAYADVEEIEHTDLGKQ